MSTVWEKRAAAAPGNSFDLAKPVGIGFIVTAMLPLVARVFERIEWNEARLLEAASDPKLEATARALEKAKAGVPFRDAYREESRRASDQESRGA